MNWSEILAYSFFGTVLAICLVLWIAGRRERDRIHWPENDRIVRMPHDWK